MSVSTVDEGCLVESAAELDVWAVVKGWSEGGGPEVGVPTKRNSTRCTKAPISLKVKTYQSCAGLLFCVGLR
jgi:hypothetical protein